jgi:hypothetical protein
VLPLLLFLFWGNTAFAQSVTSNLDALEHRVEVLEYAANDASDAAGVALETRYKIGLLEGEVATANKLLGGLITALLAKIGADIYATRRRK